MKDSIIFNWPPGAGGDFLMTLMHLEKRSGVRPTMHYSTNKYNANDENNNNVIRTFGKPEPIVLTNKEYEHIIYTHCLFRYVESLPDNIVVINIDNSSNKFFTDLLLVLKSRKSEIYEHKIFSNEPVSNFSNLFPNHKKFYNFKYEDVLSTTYNNNELELFFSLFDVQLTDDMLQCIELYAKINEIMVNRTSISTLENLEDRYAYTPSYELDSINHLYLLLTKKLNELTN